MSSYKNLEEYVRAKNKWLAEEPQSPKCVIGDTEIVRITPSGELTFADDLCLTREEVIHLVNFLNSMYGGERERSSEAV